MNKIGIDDKVILEINKYDRKYASYIIDVKEIEVRLTDESWNWWGGRRFVLTLLQNKKQIHKQYEVGNWDLEKFKEIYKAIKEKQGKPVYLNFATRKRLF